MIGKKLEEIRKNKNYSQRKLGLKAGISYATISRIENGLNTPDTETLKKITNALNVPLNILLDEKVVHKIPVLGVIPAGLPLEAVEEILDYEEITPEMASKGEYFGLKVSGQSMAPEIKHGDIVIVRKQNSFESGDICVIIVNGYDATLKTVKKESSGITLLGYNPAFPATYYSAEDIEMLPVKIIGKAVEVRRSL